MTAFDPALAERLIAESRESRLALTVDSDPLTVEVVDFANTLADQLEAAGVRIDELLRAMVRITNETPFPTRFLLRLTGGSAIPVRYGKG